MVIIFFCSFGQRQRRRQMIAGVAVVFMTTRCHEPDYTWIGVAVALYASFLLLFVKYFVDRYLASEARRTDKAKKRE